MPKISVIVPIYKVEDYLSRCIDSILGQTFTDFELILVDDGSPDNCGTICDKYAEKDVRIHVIHKENGGLSDARNAGIDWTFANSNSEWITFIDSDDWIHQRYLELLYYAAVENECGISVCNFIETTGKEPFVNQIMEMEIVGTEDFFCEHNVNAVIACAKLYQKNLFRDIRYPYGKLHEDEYTTYKVLFKCNTIVFIKNPLYYYYRNGNSITKSKWTPKHLDQMEAIHQTILFLKKCNFEKAYVFEIQNHTINIISHYYLLRESNNTKYIKSYLPKVISALRKNLRMAKEYKLYPMNKFAYYYEIAYPVEMKLFWYWQAIKRKVKRRVK